MKASRLISILTAAIAVALIPISSVWAQSSGPYLRLDGGVNFIEDTSAQIGGLPGNLSLDAGYRVDAVAGYEFNRWLALEVEGGYFENSISSVSLHNQGANPKDSSLSGVPLLGNLVLRCENKSDFVPYIGAGAGGVVSFLKISGQKDSDFVFAFQGKIGLIYKIEERAWIDVGYKILVAQEQHFSIGGTSIQTEKTFNHFLGVSVVWKF
jgi:opacity protein-like surface antigen